ncbi:MULTISPECIES: type III PLP-dependent enzyme [unclassified Paracoccus (in: a-proteobacteria)]|uniref:type III PLP-dependent enzyme n=1 Tax=unclassified Paracoccus (in: a-proteobacteria) TaxID=2688777 RepID=UPI001E54D449|nr:MULTISPECIES: type III PLP-dependent enzyme [unclassified Paracoccus (in: a-proteobacteria)]UXU74675.1 type III PLP-dependent enzyme [Paracoccus sp. SMMA_5]UXU80570.1 type III PLP-dependent enzyme [Paracoccus sp. SMMA_5_TC]
MAEPSLDRVLTQAATQFGTPAYVYCADTMAQRLADLRAHFSRWFKISFAVKSNPNPGVLGWMLGRVDSLDISSGGEFALARQAGWPADRISFTGPAKREAELRAVIQGGIGELVVESLREARLADQIAAECNRVQEIMVRLAPDRVPRGFGDQMAGRPSAFGIDIEDAAEVLPQIAALPHLRIIGLHIYSGTQCLKPEAICENWRIFMRVFRDTCATMGLKPRRLIFGAGLGIPYHPGDTALDLAAIAADIGPDLDAFCADAGFADCQLVLELGRYLVGPAGWFLTRVLSVKQSRGTRMAICDGGLNANLAASGNFGMVLRRNYVMHRIDQGDNAARAEEKTDICGPLCTSIDKLGSGVLLPRLDEGDLLAIHACGAYGPTASPVHFISHPMPREILVENGELREITRL